MEKPCSERQVWVAVFVALLAPASALPGMLARSGSLGWLGPLLTFPLAALVVWRLGRFGPQGLARAWAGRWGALGRGALTLYYIWALALSALTAGSCVDRLRRTDYASFPSWLLALALAGVCAYLVCRGRGAFFRAVEIFYLALLVVLVLFFALGVWNLQGRNLVPRDVGELSGLGQGLLSVGATLSAGTLAAFVPRSGEGGRGLRWLWGWCAVAAGLCALVIGALGPQLTARVPLAFFLALQGLGFPGGFQRLEALGTAAWVLSDLALLGLAALAGREMAGGRRWGPAPPLLAAFLGGCLLPNAALEGAAPVLLGANLCLGAALPVLLSLLPEGGPKN